MKKTSLLCALASSVIISGCAGTHLSTEEVHQFSLNHDTEATVKSKLGEPWETFKAVNEDEMKEAISNLPEINTSDYIHRLGVYTFSFSPLLSHDNAYFELNIFAYTANGVLQDVAEYTCFTQKGCEDILESEKQKYAVEDWKKLNEDVKALIKDKKQKQLLAEKQKKADEERKRRLALAKAANVKKKSEAASAGTVTAGTVQKTVKTETTATPAVPAPASTAEQPKTAVRRNISL